MGRVSFRENGDDVEVSVSSVRSRHFMGGSLAIFNQRVYLILNKSFLISLINLLLIFGFVLKIPCRPIRLYFNLII